MDDRFRRYEEEFLNASRNVSRTMKQLSGANGVVDVIISVCVEIDGELSEAEGYLKAMEVEFRAMVSGDKRSSQQKVMDYKDEFKRLLQEFQSTKASAESQALKGGSAARTKLLNANQRLDQSTNTLEKSRMLIAQTETIGTTIISDMENQKEILQDANVKVKETSQFTYDAKGILRMMGNRAIMHKCIVIFIIIFLLGMIGVVGYYGFVAKK